MLSKRPQTNGAAPVDSAARLPKRDTLTLTDRWILSRYTRLAGDVKRLMEGYNFGEAGRQVQDFLWSDFADWYVEIAKVQLENEATAQQTYAILAGVLEGALRLLHPFMPYVTEVTWQFLTEGTDAARTSSISLADWPAPDAALLNEQADAAFERLRDAITAIRNLRNEYKVEAARQIAATIVTGETALRLDDQAPLICRLARVDPAQLTIVERLDEKPTQAATLVLGTIEVYLPLAGLVDMAAEKARLEKELESTEAEVRRREQQLANERFVARAPAEWCSANAKASNWHGQRWRGCRHGLLNWGSG
ncbi:MAG: class I tRNA ligase family protein, partial [Lewinella sp.]|nr:class I tRNA ligase family protein [Lewinella sp.]